MTVHRKVEKNIRLLEAYTVLVQMGFLIPVLVPYYRDRMGLDFRDFLIGEACFAAVIVLLEVPTGWISDVWRRKHTLAAACLFDFAGYFCLLIGDSLMWAILGQSLIGVAISLMSGTNQAMLYDTLLSCNRTGEYRMREGRRSALMFYSVAGASIAGGFLYTVDTALPVILTLVAIASAWIAALLMHEPERHKRLPEKHPLADMAATAKYALHGHADVGMIILFAAAMFCSTKMIMWAQQPYYIAVGVPEYLFGVLMAAGFMLAGLSSQYGHKLDGKVGSVKALAGVWLIAIAICITTGLDTGWIGIGLLMLAGSCLYGLANPRVSEAINDRVDSARRATVLSTQGLMTNLFFMPLSLTIGWVSEGWGINQSMLAIALWLMIAGIALAALALRRGGKRMMLL